MQNYKVPDLSGVVSASIGDSLQNLYANDSLSRMVELAAQNSASSSGALAASYDTSVLAEAAFIASNLSSLAASIQDSMSKIDVPASLGIARFDYLTGLGGLNASEFDDEEPGDDGSQDPDSPSDAGITTDQTPL